MFEKVMSRIDIIMEATPGTTGYLDGLESKVPARGIDVGGRPFFVLPIILKDESGFDVLCYVTFFQRYSNDKNTWVEVASHKGCGGGEAMLFHTAPITEKRISYIEDALLRLLDRQQLDEVIPKEVHGCWGERKVHAALLGVNDPTSYHTRDHHYADEVDEDQEHSESY